MLAVLAAAFAASAVEAIDEQPDLTIAQADPAPPSEPAEPAPAQASDDAGEEELGDVPEGVEVIHVRGRGSAAIEADVPASLTLFDAKTIEALGAQDISDLSRVTPNVNIVQPGATQATFFVRGVGLSDFSSNAAGAVTIFQDDVAIDPPAIQTGQLFDVEGIEVVRGPQGSGPFRNASAGAIRVRSRRPTGNYSSQLRSSIGWYDDKGDKGAYNAMIQDYEGAVEMPFTTALSSRFAFRLREADPYKKNGCGDAPPFELRTQTPFNAPGVAYCGETRSGGGFVGSFPGTRRSGIPEGLPRRVQDEHNWAARGTLRLHPDDADYDFFLNGHGSRLDQDSTLGQAIGTDPLGGAENPGNRIRFAGDDSADYVDPDVRREYDEICGDLNPSLFTVNCANRYALAIMAKRLAQGRPLDEKPYRGDYDRVGQTTRDAWGGFLSGEGNVFEDVKLSGIASFDQYERSQDTDTDFTPNRLFELVQKDKAWQMFHQLQLEGELEAEPIQWNLGAYWLREDLDNHGTLLLAGRPDALGRAGAFSDRKYEQLIDSLGIWGGFVWDFADDFTLEGGVRYNWEKKEFDFEVTQNIPFEQSCSTNIVCKKEEETWQTPTGQLILTYHIDEEKSVFAKYSRGFKAGHFNALASTGTGADGRTLELLIDPADEEYNDAWEAGISGGWLNRALSLRSSFFYYRYTNYQVFLFVDGADPASPPVLSILNAQRAENFGVEVEGMVQPLMGWTPSLVSGLRISGNFSWLHGEYIDFATTKRFVGVGATGALDVPVDYSGKRLQNAPEYKASGTVEWTLDLGRFGYLIPRYDINWSDDVFFDPNEGRGSIDPAGGPALVDYAIGQKAYFLHNVRLAYRTPTGNVELAGWIRNVEDQVYKNYAFDASSFTRLVINFVGEPRTMGVDLTITF